MKIIKIKRGSGAPLSLSNGELGYDSLNKILYIGTGSGPVKVFKDTLSKAQADSAYMFKSAANEAYGFVEKIGGKIPEDLLFNVWPDSEDYNDIIAVDHVVVPGTDEVYDHYDFALGYAHWTAKYVNDAFTKNADGDDIAGGGAGIYFLSYDEGQDLYSSMLYLCEYLPGAAQLNIKRSWEANFWNNIIFASNANSKIYRVEQYHQPGGGYMTGYALDQIPTTIDGGTW